MPQVYCNYSDFTWDNRPFVHLAFSSHDRYHDNHFWKFEPVKIIIATIKQIIPSSNRNYDSQNQIWMISALDRVKLENMFAPTKIYEWNHLGDVLDYVLFSKSLFDAQLDAQRKKAQEQDFKNRGIKVEAAEDFFHQFKEPQANAPAMPILEIKKRLFTLMNYNMEVQLTKTDYRKAALALHPDRNNGDGSKMSELNMLWQEYVKLCPEAK